MADKENVRSMESKIQEIERLMAEVVDDSTVICHSTKTCNGCVLRSSLDDKFLIRRRLCDNITGIID